MGKSHKNRVLALLLSLAMIITYMPATALVAWADDESVPPSAEEENQEPVVQSEGETEYVAQIGEVKYETLADAIDAASEGSTIVLLKNVAYGEFEGTALNVSSGKSFTLDLAGKTISGTAVNSGTSQLINISKDAAVIIADSKGSGKITYNSTKPDPAWGYGTYTIHNAGTLTIKAGTIENKTVYGASYAIENHANWQAEDVTFNLEGGVVTCPKGDQAVRLYSNWGGSMTKVGKSIMNMTGGTIEAGGIWVNDQVAKDKGGFIELNVSGGVINGMLDFIGAKDQTSINITGGTFNTDNLRLRNTAAYGNTKPYVNISDEAVIKLEELENQNSGGAAANTMMISGGTFIFNDAVKNNLAEGFYDSSFEIVANNDNDYPWKLGTAVASIGEVKYATLADAVAAVTNSDTKTGTIKILTDINYGEFTEASAVEIPASDTVTLDLNGHTISGISKKGSSAQLVLNNGALTITDTTDNKDGRILCSADPTWKYDGSENYSGSYASNTITNLGTLVLEHGSIENASSGSAVYAIDTYKGSVTINDGSVRVAKSNALRLYPCKGAPLNVEINGGTLYSKTYWPVQIHGGNGQNVNLTINGGEILTGGNANNLALYVFAGGDMSKTKLTINGGTFNGDVTATAQLPTANLKVTGGQFGGPYGIYSYSYEGNYISGGVYSGTYWSNFLEDGLAMVANTDPETKDAYPWTVGRIYTVELTSAVDKCENITSIAHLAGGGQFTDGDTTTISAPDLTDFGFDGWYLNGEKVSEEHDYTITVSSSAKYVAVYKTDNTKTATITANALAGGSVDKTSVAASIGETVKITATPDAGKKFVYWTNKYGRVLSKSPTLDIVAVNDLEVTAVFSDSSASTVVFQDASGNVLSAQTYTAESASKISKVIAPSKLGSEFVGWTATEDITTEHGAIKVGDRLSDTDVADIIKASSDKNHIIVRADYEQRDTYTIIVKAIINGEEQDEPIINVSKNVGTPTVVSVNPESNLGVPLKEIQSGSDVIKANTFTVNPVAGTYEYTAVYEDEASLNSEVGVISINPPNATYTNSEKIDLTMSWTLPADATFVDAGFYCHVDKAGVENHTKGAAHTGIFSNTGSTTIHLNVAGHLDTQVYAQAFVTYIYDGVTRTIYSSSIGTKSFELDNPESDTSAYTVRSYNSLKNN